ncbi:MAG: ABC transporter ATP-binding protein [Gemmataceae bacterium]
MIIIQDLSVKAGAFVLNNISFTLDGGEYGVLMGQTGSGKTTILEAVAGLKTVISGSIRLDDVEVAHLKPAERGIGYVPQDRALFPSMTVSDHLGFALVLRRWPKKQVKERVEQMAELLGIHDLLQRKPLGLSGGESQRVALGRALSYYPKILLLDEPLSALDEGTRETMCRLLKRIQLETGVTTLHVTHSLAEARRLANRVLVLRNKVLSEVPPDGLDKNPLANESELETNHESAESQPDAHDSDGKFTRLSEGS